MADAKDTAKAIMRLATNNAADVLLTDDDMAGETKMTVVFPDGEEFTYRCKWSGPEEAA